MPNGFGFLFLPLTTHQTKSATKEQGMPGLKHEQLQSYVTQVLEAVMRRDKATLRRYGQQDGFISDRIRQLVWFPSHFLWQRWLIDRPCLLDCEDIEYSLYDDRLGFPDMDERDILTIQQDVRRSFTRFPGHSLSFVESGLTLL